MQGSSHLGFLQFLRKIAPKRELPLNPAVSSTPGYFLSQGRVLAPGRCIICRDPKLCLKIGYLQFRWIILFPTKWIFRDLPQFQTHGIMVKFVKQYNPVLLRNSTFDPKHLPGDGWRRKLQVKPCCWLVARRVLLMFHPTWHDKPQLSGSL